MRGESERGRGERGHGGTTPQYPEVAESGESEMRVAASVAFST